MKKKTIALAMTMILSMTAFSACGKTEEPAAAASSAAEAASSVVEEAASSTEEAASSAESVSTESTSAESESAASSTEESTSSASEEASAEASEETADVVGKYWTVIEMRDIINQDSEEIGFAFTSSVPMAYNLELRDDGTFFFGVDEDSYKDDMVGAVVNDIDNIIATLLGMEELDEEMAELVAQSAGYESYEAFKEDMIAEMTQAMTEGEDSGLEDAQVEGTYLVRGKTIGLLSNTESSLGFDSATLQDDGTITMKTGSDGMSMDLTFVKGIYTEADEALKQELLGKNTIVIEEGASEAA